MTVYEARAWVSVILSYVVENHTTAIVSLVFAVFWATCWMLESIKNGQTPDI